MTKIIYSISQRLYIRHKFIDFIHIERLISISEGYPNEYVNTFGTNGIFYSSSLKVWNEQLATAYLNRIKN